MENLKKAAITRWQIVAVERGLLIFLKLVLVEVMTDGSYYLMSNIELLIGQSSTGGGSRNGEASR